MEKYEEINIERKYKDVSRVKLKMWTAIFSKNGINCLEKTAQRLEIKKEAYHQVYEEKYEWL